MKYTSFIRIYDEGKSYTYDFEASGIEEARYKIRRKLERHVKSISRIKYRMHPLYDKKTYVEVAGTVYPDAIVHMTVAEI